MAIWTGDSDSGTDRRHIFDLTLPLDDLLERGDFEDLCYEIEHNLGVLDSLGFGEGEESYMGFWSDVEPTQVDELIGRFGTFLRERGLIVADLGPDPSSDSGIDFG